MGCVMLTWEFKTCTMVKLISIKSFDSVTGAKYCWLQWWGSVYFKEADPYPYLLRTLFYISFMKYLLSVLKISKTLVFFLRTSDLKNKRPTSDYDFRYHILRFSRFDKLNLKVRSLLYVVYCKERCRLLHQLVFLAFLDTKYIYNNMFNYHLLVNF